MSRIINKQGIKILNQTILIIILSNKLRKYPYKKRSHYKFGNPASRSLNYHLKSSSGKQISYYKNSKPTPVGHGLTMRTRFLKVLPIHWSKWYIVLQIDSYKSYHYLSKFFINSATMTPTSKIVIFFLDILYSFSLLFPLIICWCLLMLFSSKE